MLLRVPAPFTADSSPQAAGCTFFESMLKENAPTLGMALLLLAVVPAICEEFAFRGAGRSREVRLTRPRERQQVAHETIGAIRRLDDVAEIGGGLRVEPRLAPLLDNDTNQMELRVYGNEELRQAVLVARLDNLGKGASGAAVQAMNVHLGVDEGLGL